MKTPDITPRQLGNIRLMQLSHILDNSVFAYVQRKFRSDESYDAACCTPACALGHWAHHNQDRWTFTRNYGPWLNTEKDVLRHGHEPDGEIVCETDRGFEIVDVVTGPITRSAMKEFDITQMEYSDLFGIEGCGKAKTARQAAAYIRAFVESRLETENEVESIAV